MRRERFWKKVIWERPILRFLHVKYVLFGAKTVFI